MARILKKLRRLLGMNKKMNLEEITGTIERFERQYRGKVEIQGYYMDADPVGIAGTNPMQYDGILTFIYPKESSIDPIPSAVMQQIKQDLPDEFEDMLFL